MLCGLVGATAAYSLGKATNPAGNLHPNEPQFLFTNDTNFPFKNTGTFENNELVYKFIVSVILVIAFGGVAIYLSRRLGSKPGLKGKRIKVIESIYLGTRKNLHLVRIGNKEILIGSTNENICKLTDVTDALDEISGKD